MTMEQGTLITGARVFDGQGFLPDGTAVAVAEGRIVHVGQILDLAEQGFRRVDGSGSILSPAFIDTHNHGDYHGVDPDNDGVSALAQGVGTLVVGNCGYSATPTGTVHAVLMPEAGDSNVPLPDHLARLDHGLALDIGDLLGHNTLRRHVMGEARAATPAEIDRMCGLLDDFLAAGGMGLSVGLNYPEAIGYGAAEMVPLCRVLARHGRPLTCHIADQGAGILQSVGEVVAWADAAGCQVLVSHMRPISDRYDHLLDPLFSIFETRQNARFDLYPYAAGFTTLAWLFSYLFQRTPAVGARVPGDELEEAARGVCIGGLDDVRVLASTFPDAAGHTIGDIARSLNQPAGEVAQDIYIADPSTVCLYERESRPETIDRIITHPLCLVGSDGYLFGHRHTAACHPRCYGAFAGFIERYARPGHVDQVTALSRMTSAPAAFFSLSDRGRIAPGLRADLALLDWDRIGENAGKDGTRIAHGVRMTMVGGAIAYEGGPQATGRRAGARAVPTAR
ncbi:amidohydrolase family protein [Kaistia adipata]|uniref:amidohydrolase family protein n=1 Tax=Kaistia adipata TaxID=166954 RepID=UPI0004122F1F|nr:amidohydrolase family protein [Kaistia adipata]